MVISRDSVKSYDVFVGDSFRFSLVVGFVFLSQNFGHWRLNVICHHVNLNGVVGILRGAGNILIQNVVIELFGGGIKK